MPKKPTKGAFTPRIIETLELKSRDLSNKRIAEKMFISEEAVKSNLKRGREISGLHEVCAMFRKAVEDGDIIIDVKKYGRAVLPDITQYFPIAPFRYQ